MPLLATLSYWPPAAHQAAAAAGSGSMLTGTMVDRSVVERLTSTRFHLGNRARGDGDGPETARKRPRVGDGGHGRVERDALGRCYDQLRPLLGRWPAVFPPPATGRAAARDAAVRPASGTPNHVSTPAHADNHPSWHVDLGFLGGAQAADEMELKFRWAASAVSSRAFRPTADDDTGGEHTCQFDSTAFPRAITAFQCRQQRSLPFSACNNDHCLSVPATTITAFRCLQQRWPLSTGDRTTGFGGLYLLPLIDMLNHEHSGGGGARAAGPATTLRWSNGDDDGSGGEAEEPRAAETASRGAVRDPELEFSTAAHTNIQNTQTDLLTWGVRWEEAGGGGGSGAGGAAVLYDGRGAGDSGQPPNSLRAEWPTAAAALQLQRPYGAGHPMACCCNGVESQWLAAATARMQSPSSGFQQLRMAHTVLLDPNGHVLHPFLELRGWLH